MSSKGFASWHGLVTQAAKKIPRFNLDYVFFPLTSECHFENIGPKGRNDGEAPSAPVVDGLRGSKRMIEKMLEFVRSIGCNGASQRRVRKPAAAARKLCQYCNATIYCQKSVCKNCYAPLAQGLAGEKWVSQELKRKVNHLEALDSVKYNQSGSYAIPADLLSPEIRLQSKNSLLRAC